MAQALSLKPAVVVPFLHPVSSRAFRTGTRPLQHRCSSFGTFSPVQHHSPTPRDWIIAAADGAAAETEQGLDGDAYDAERLRLDAEARDQMAAELKQVEERGASSDGTAAEGEEKPGAWKWAIRKRIWDLLEAENLAQNPRPVHHRIPNFVGAEAAAAKV